MRKKSVPKKSGKSSLRMLVIFCVVVFLAISISLGYRLFVLMRGSKFDANHNFVIAFTYHNDIDILEINPAQKGFNHLIVRGGKTLSEAEQDLDILTDSRIKLSQPFSLTDVSHYFSSAAWHRDTISSDLNIYDLYRLSLATSHIPSDSLTTQTLHIPFDPTVSQSMLEQLFLDETIDQENKTVSIINGTGVPGLGTRLEQALSVMGVNVISVTNADGVKSTSSITFSSDKSYTLTRLQHLLDVPTSQSTSQNLSDIIILIGRDMGQTTKF